MATLSMGRSFRALILAASVIICCPLAKLWACSAALIGTPAMIDGSEVIVRTEVIGATAGHDALRGQIQLKVLEVLRGRFARDSFRIEGNIAEVPAPPPRRAVPYDELDCLRAKGCGGCFAYDYQQGHQYLLFLKDGNPYWAPLEPANEEVFGSEDPWVVWVKAYLAKAKP